jgi:hypothetical protein
MFFLLFIQKLFNPSVFKPYNFEFLPWISLLKKKKKNCGIVSGSVLKITEINDSNSLPIKTNFNNYNIVLHPYFYCNKTIKSKHMIAYASRDNFTNKNSRFSHTIFIGYQTIQIRHLSKTLISVLSTKDENFINEIFKVLNLYCSQFQGSPGNEFITKKFLKDLSITKLFLVIEKNRYTCHQLILDLEETIAKSSNKIILNDEYRQIQKTFSIKSKELPLITGLQYKNIMEKLYTDNFELNFLDIKIISDDLKLNQDILLLKITFNISPYIFESSSLFSNEKLKGKLFLFFKNHSNFSKKYIFFSNFEKLEPLSILGLVFDTGRDNYHDLDNYHKSLILILMESKNTSN